MVTKRMPFAAKLILMIALIAITLVSTPSEKALGFFEGLGLPADMVPLVMAALPAVLMALVLFLIDGLGPALKAGPRIGLQAGLGAIVGFVFALMFDAFGRLSPGLNQSLGQMREIAVTEYVAITLALMFLLGGLATFFATVLRLSPAKSMAALDRGAQFHAGLGLIAQGLALGSLLLLHLAEFETLSAGHYALASVMVVSVGLAIFTHQRVLAHMDEFNRAIVLTAYAWSGALAIMAATVWAGLEALKLVPGMRALDAVVWLTLLQTLGAVAASVQRMGLEASSCEPGEAS